MWDEPPGHSKIQLVLGSLPHLAQYNTPKVITISLYPVGIKGRILSTGKSVEHYKSTEL